jgi:hypothetical protein
MHLMPGRQRHGVASKRQLSRRQLRHQLSQVQLAPPCSENGAVTTAAVWTGHPTAQPRHSTAQHSSCSLGVVSGACAAAATGRAPRASACRCRVGSRAAGSGSTKRTQSPDSRPSRNGATDQASSPPEQAAGFSALRVAAKRQASGSVADRGRELRRFYRLYFSRTTLTAGMQHTAVV